MIPEHNERTINQVPLEIREKLLNALPMGIAVYHSKDGYVSVLSANEYMNTHFGSKDKHFIDYEETDMRSFVYEEDWHQTMDVRRILTTGEGGSEARIYRLLPIGAGPRWFFVRGASFRMDDGSYIFYVLYSDVDSRQNRLREYNQNIDMLLKSNPDVLCAAKFNLSHNLVTDRHGVSEYSQHLLDVDTVDAWTENLLAIIVPQRDDDVIRREFGRERMLDNYESGRNRYVINYLRLDAKKQPVWRRTYFNLMRNPSTGDVEAAVYTVDYTNAYKENQIFRLLAQDDYDSLGTIDAESGEVHLLLNAQGFFGGSTVTTLTDAATIAANKIINLKERENFLNEVTLPAIKETLRHTDVMSLTITTGDTLTNLVFRYLDEYKRDIMFVSRDITAFDLDQKEHERRLRQALQDAREATQMKNEFFGNVSHDLRTPLNAILGYARLVKNIPDVPEKATGYVDKIEDAGETMLTLVKDTLDLQKLESQGMVLNTGVVYAQNIIDRVLAVVTPKVSEKTLSLSYDVTRVSGRGVITDEDRLMQVIINIISNAIKFTPPKGEVSITFECLGEDDGILHEKFTVRDTGIGMSPDFVKRMFEPFAQERTPETAHLGGSGLGLAITKRIVELMGGTIEARSELGTGTVVDVFLDLPLAEVPQEETPETNTNLPLTGLSILLCDDNDMNVEIAEALLEDEGAEVDVTYDAGTCLKKFYDSEEGTYDIIITDIRMPGMDGFELARRVRAATHPQAALIPILAISSDAYASDVQKSLEAGMNAHLPKPLDPGQVVEAILHYTGTS